MDYQGEHVSCKIKEPTAIDICINFDSLVSQNFNKDYMGKIIFIFTDCEFSFTREEIKDFLIKIKTGQI